MTSKTLYESEFAERAAKALQSAEYHVDVKRHTKLGVGAIVIGLGGGVISLWMLLTGPAVSGQAASFWLLCLILSAGVFAVAVLTLAASLSSHLAMQRLALGNKEVEIVDATREIYAMIEEINALAALVAEVGAKQQVLDYRIVQHSLKCIARPPTAEQAPAHHQAMRSLLDKWKALGASSQTVESFGGLTTSGGVGRY